MEIVTVFVICLFEEQNLNNILNLTETQVECRFVRLVSGVYERPNLFLMV